MHKRLLENAVKELSKVEGITKIILFGSVLREDYREDSDIDLALICEDFYHNLPLDFEGFPFGFKEKITKSLEGIEKDSTIIFDFGIYWNSEYERGIFLYGSGRNPHRLNGKIIYEKKFC